MSTFFSGNSYDFTSYVDAKNWIGGEWVDAQNSETFDVINPRYGLPMGKAVMSGAKDVAAAVAAAKKALPDWRERPIRERGEVMYNLRQLMHTHLEELTWLVSHENGKTYGEAKAEVLKAIECAEYGCSLPNIAAAPQLEVSRGVECRIVYEPVGIVAGITPFNFPLMVPLWMLPQALSLKLQHLPQVLRPVQCQWPPVTLFPPQAAVPTEAGLPCHYGLLWQC